MSENKSVIDRLCEYGRPFKDELGEGTLFHFHSGHKFLLAETDLAALSDGKAVEPVAWQDATGKELHKIILNYQKQDMVLAGGRQGERAENYSIPLYAAPPTTELEALRKRVAELEKALEPFAEASRWFDEATAHFGVALTPDHRTPRAKFTHGELLTAAVYAKEGR